MFQWSLILLRDLTKVLTWDIGKEHDSAAELIALLKEYFLLIIFNDLQEKCSFAVTLTSSYVQVPAGPAFTR